MNGQDVFLTVDQYAAARGISRRQVARYLAGDRIPGAVQDDAGRWYLPAPDPSAVTVRATPAARTAPAAAVTLAGSLDHLPAYVDVDTAARLLGITTHAVRTHAVELGGRRWGERGAWVIPVGTVRAAAGIAR